MSSDYELKSLERRAFEFFLRTGRRLPSTPARTESERKFNPWHDPENGQFTDAMHGSASLGGASRTPAPRATGAPSPNPSTPKLPQPKRTAPSEPARPRTWRQGGDLKPAEVESRADRAMAQYYENRSRGMQPDEAAAWAANSEIESFGDHTLRQVGGGPGRGLYQWGSDVSQLDHRIDFEQAMRVPIERSTRDQQHRFRDHELNNKERSAKLAIDAASGAGDKAFVISMRYLRPASKELTATARANLAEAILRKARLQARKKVKPKKRTGVHVYLPALM